MRRYQATAVCLLLLAAAAPGEAWKPRLWPKNRASNGGGGGGGGDDGMDFNVDQLPFLASDTSGASGGQDFFFASVRGTALSLPPWKEAWQGLKHIIFFKPPVGIVTMYCLFRLVFSGRIFRLYAEDQFNSVDEVLQGSTKRSGRHQRRRRRHKRALDLDKDDMAYDAHGGVESVRRKLCDAVLKHDVSPNDPDVLHVLGAIHVMYQSSGPRIDYVKDIAQHLIQVKQIKTRKMHKDDIVKLAYTVAEIRALDALLRITRDRLLITSSKMKRLVKYWRSRIRVVSKMGRWGKLLVSDSYMEDDRQRLSLALGAYKDEVTRLGKTQNMLSARPTELSEHELIEALALSKTAVDSEEHEPKSWLSKLAIRWNAEGRGRLTIRYFQQNTHITSEAARSVLEQRGDMKWIQDASDWIDSARNELCDILRESVRKDVVEASVQKHVDRIDDWCDSRKACTLEQWNSVSELVDSLAEHERVGMGTVISLRDPKVVQVLQDVDVLGIPSTLAFIGLARIAHELLQPRWPAIQSWLLHGYTIAWTIVRKRIWTPLKDILVNLATRQNESLLQFFDVNNEVTSLDNMLKDLGFGDGTEATRQEALALASRRYEKDLEQGLIMNAMRGRLIRLLLVQVQQLKAGLLHALDSIDVLVAANRLNVQLLAAIPAVLIMTLGARVVVRSMYTFRLKAIRSIRDVHAEMADYLDEMEKQLLLENCSMGEFVLHMHSYLVLLDYSSPVFPSRSLDAIHRSMQDLLQSSSTTTVILEEQELLERDNVKTSTIVTMNQQHNMRTRQVQILRLVKEKHAGLLKYL
jgi:nuclear-control-of-ATPase protein 2